MSDLFDSPVAMSAVIARLVEQHCGGYVMITQEELSETIAKYNLSRRLETDEDGDVNKDRIHILLSSLTKPRAPKEGMN